VRRLLAACLLLFATNVQAQSWANRPVRWIVAFPPGGPTDLVARVVGAKLSEQIGQPVVIENRPGAGGNIGADAVVKAPPDGHTLLLAIPAVITNPFFFKSSPDSLQDLTPVIQMTGGPMVLLASQRFAARSVGDVVQAIKARPGEVSCGVPGSLATVGCELLRAHAGAEILRVAYRGNEPALLGLQRGDIDLVFDFVSSAGNNVAAGRGRAIAVTSLKRISGTFAELPAVAETIPDFELMGWHAVMAPAGTPAPIVQRINEAINVALRAPEVKERLANVGVDVVGGSAEAFGERLRREFATYGAAMKASGVQPQ
jgi:tripartite-type tricarboxylate transporter receptor subunit TctC